MSTFSTLEIGKRALQSNNFGLDVTSNNIANVNTKGYSRRQAVQSEADPFKRYGFAVGTGVDMESLRSFRQEYLDREIRKANARFSAYEVDVLLFNSIEVVMKEPTDSNIGESINRFLYAFDELSLQPEVLGLRENLLSMSQTLVERFNKASNEFLEMRRQANTDIVNAVDEANKLINLIAEYNKAIAISKDPSRNDALTFIDKREVAIEALSHLGNVSVSYESNGLANVFINGINVVTGPSKHNLMVVENNNEATGESTLTVMMHDERRDFYININPASGKLAASLRHYNVELNPELSTGGFSVVQTLNTYVRTFAEAVNSFFAVGYGLNDVDGAPAGRVLFESNSGDPITAGNIKLSMTMEDAADIPFSATPNTPGNGDIALQISRIMQDGQFLEGQNPMEFYSNFIGRVSQNANEATNGKKATQLVVEHLNSTRDSVMGVNMDEEAISLIKFQKNLEAASRIIATTNQVLSTIINLGL